MYALHAALDLLPQATPLVQIPQNPYRIAQSTNNDTHHDSEPNGGTEWPIVRETGRILRRSLL